MLDAQLWMETWFKNSYCHVQNSRRQMTVSVTAVRCDRVFTDLLFNPATGRQPHQRETNLVLLFKFTRVSCPAAWKRMSFCWVCAKTPCWVGSCVRAGKPHHKIWGRTCNVLKHVQQTYWSHFARVQHTFPWGGGVWEFWILTSFWNWRNIWNRREAAVLVGDHVTIGMTISRFRGLGSSSVGWRHWQP